MSCPYCNAEKYINETAAINARTYNQSGLSATICCKKPIRVSSRQTIVAEPVMTHKTEDDWGNPFQINSLVDKYILVKYDYNITTGTIHKVIEDDRRNSWVKVDSSASSFNRSAILFVGTKSEMEMISKDHAAILNNIKLRQQATDQEFKRFLESFHEFKYFPNKE